MVIILIFRLTKIDGTFNKLIYIYFGFESYAWTKYNNYYFIFFFFLNIILYTDIRFRIKFFFISLHFLVDDFTVSKLYAHIKNNIEPKHNFFGLFTTSTVDNSIIFIQFMTMRCRDERI